VTSAVLFSEKITLSAPVGYLEYSEKATKKAKNFIDITTAKNSRKDRTMKESVKKFAEEMARRLDEHDADLEVAGLNHYSLAYFTSKLIDETKELEEYVGSGDLNGGRKVAVDVANSSRAIFDICTKLLDGNGE
jgi:hypothetical protein